MLSTNILSPRHLPAPDNVGVNSCKRIRLDTDDQHNLVIKSIFTISPTYMKSLEAYTHYTTHYSLLTADPPRSLSYSEFGARLRELFPELKKKRHQVNGVRTAYYNVCYRGKENVPHFGNVSAVAATLSNIRNYIANEPMFGVWGVVTSSKDSITLVSGDLQSNGDFYSERQIVIKEDMSWAVHVNGKPYNGIYGIPDFITTMSEIKSIVLQVGAYTLPSCTANNDVGNTRSCSPDILRTLKNCKERERYWRDISMLQRNTLQLIEKDNEDLVKMLEFAEQRNVSEAFKGNREMEILWNSQIKEMKQKNKKGMRWHPEIIKLCLKVWHQSKKAYEDLRESGFLKLPSGRELRYYSNSVDSSPGLNKTRLEWMKYEAEKAGISEFGRHGAIIFDEMTIQEDIQLKHMNGKWEIVGVARMNETVYQIKECTEGQEKPQLATHVLQLMFLGNTGFRFPFTYFPTTEASAMQLFETLWESVDTLQMYGFHVRLSICDGASVNRKFVLMHFEDEKNAQLKMYTTTSPSSGKSMKIMDPSHNFKKIRNAIEHSRSTCSSAKKFAIEDQGIFWEHLNCAYEYDVNTNSLQTHRRLTDDHFQLTSTSKMRNHLADDVLGEDMLDLVKVYQRHLSKTGSASKHLDLTIEFLQMTSKLLKNFKHLAPYSSLEDTRFTENRQCLNWIEHWEKDANAQTHLPRREQKKRFLADQTKFDIYSMILGFESFCRSMFSDFPGCGIVTAKTNQDVLENFFGGARSRNGVKIRK